MENLLSILSKLILENWYIAPLMAFLAGIISSFGPCVLSSIPLIIGYVTGYAENDKSKAVKYSFVFCLGIATTFTLFGIVSASFGNFILGTSRIWYILLAIMMAILGLKTLGLIDINIKLPESMINSEKKGMIGAFIFGVVGGIISSPCSTPVLIVILTFVAIKGNILYGLLLLLSYSIGHSIPIFIAGTSTGLINKIMKYSKQNKISNTIRLIFGIIIVNLSLYLFYLGF